MILADDRGICQGPGCISFNNLLNVSGTTADNRDSGSIQFIDRALAHIPGQQDAHIQFCQTAYKV